MKNNIIISVFSGISIYALIYYTYKFYLQKNMSNVETGFWFALVFSIILLLIIGIVCSFKLTKVSQENGSLKLQISRLTDIIERYHYDEIEHIDNNMECILDLDGK